MINQKSKDMLFLEECIKNIKNKENVNSNLQNISRILSRNFDITFDIRIVENDTNKFFGMTIYPQVSELDTIVTALVNGSSSSETMVKLWQKNKLWVLDIDSLLLYDKTLNANPQEITAVLLHEIGHIVYSNSVPQRIHRVYRYERMNLSIGIKNLIRSQKISKIFSLSVIEACATKSFKFINPNKERVADSYVVKLGYGENLNNFINKLISTQGNSLINRSEKDKDLDVRAVVNWGLDNISELEFRKTKLKKSLELELYKNPSDYVRGVVTNINKSFFGSEDSAYMKAVTEQCLLQETDRIVKEGLLSIFDKLGKVKKINQSDIDILQVEIEKIENSDDKIYVLDLIYDKLELVNASLDLIAVNKADKVPQSKNTLMGMKTQLEKMRTQVLSKHVEEKVYGVFIKYPKGYEG